MGSFNIHPLSLLPLPYRYILTLRQYWTRRWKVLCSRSDCVYTENNLTNLPISIQKTYFDAVCQSNSNFAPFSPSWRPTICCCSHQPSCFLDKPLPKISRVSIPDAQRDSKQSESFKLRLKTTILKCFR